MSQVRKLQEGGKTSKTYKILYEGQEYDVTPEQLRQINDDIANLPSRLKSQVGNLDSVIQSGGFTGDRKENVMSSAVFTNVSNKDIKNLEARKSSRLDAISDSAVYRSQEATNEVLNIIYRRVVNAPKTEDKPSKATNSMDEISLDFNEKDGKKYLSPTGNYAAKKRVSDVIAHLKAGDASTYNYGDYDFGPISTWLASREGDDKYKAGSDYFENLWTTMSDPNSGYKYDPDTEDLLRLFGIKYNMTNPTASGENGDRSREDVVGDRSGSVSDPASVKTIRIGDKVYRVTGTDANGNPTVEEIVDSEEKEEEPVAEETSQPQEETNTSSLVLIKPGDRDDMDWGVYYNGVPYSYESIQPGSELGNLMAKFEENNRKMLKQGERYNANSFIQLPSIKNFADWTVGQTLDDGTDLNQFFLNQGVTSAALNHMATDANGNRYFKYYNNFDPYGTYIPRGGNTSKETPWGIRSPYYLMIDKDGNITALASSPTKDELGKDVVINNAAPKVKDLFNPATSAEAGHPHPITTGGSNIPIMPLYQEGLSSNEPHTYLPEEKRKISATFIQELQLGEHVYKLYRLPSGLLYLDGPGRNNWKLTPAQLQQVIRTGKLKKKDGGTISKSKTAAFKSKFKDIVKGQDGIPKLTVKTDSAAVPVKLSNTSSPTIKTAPKRVDTQGRIMMEDENGNVLIINSEQEPIPEEIANSVARPIDPNQKTIDDFTEATSKPGPAVIQPPFYIKNPPVQYPTDPEVFTTRIGNVEENKPISVPQVPLAKQKTVSVKTNETKTFNDLIDVLKQLVDKKQQGGTVKMQNGGIPLRNWQITREVKTGVPTSITIHNDASDSKYNLDGTVIKGDASFDFWNNMVNGAMPKTWDQLESEWDAYKKKQLGKYYYWSGKEVGTKPDITQNPLGIGMQLENGKPTGYKMSANNGIEPTSSVVPSETRSVADGGGYPQNVPDYTKHLIPLISGIRFIINSRLQQKYRDTSKKAIEAGRFNELPATLNTPRNDNPALDRALQQVRSERMAGVKPVTSDLIANNAILNQRESQLWDREQNLIGQRSQSDWEAKKEALNIMNQNIVNQTTTANSNRARNAAINSALYNPELEFIQRRGQSIENLGLEIQNNIKQDRNTILNYQRQLELQRETDALNNKLDAMFPGARQKYDLLGDDEKSKYVDYADYLRKNHTDIWNANIDNINNWQKEYTNNVRRWMYENGLNYSYPSFLTGRYSPIGYKKGGYLRGSTRYTMEPDERIWIDNNKGTHQAIAKLSDNTIKLLLRALK